MEAGEKAREKIVVLGGGCGAMAAVFALTDRPDWQDKYEITVYQPGWRLGGKGASGRNPDACYRIEEHGLHVWSGFYENAFWMMRKCYTELNRATIHPLSTAFEAFRPRHYASLGRKVRQNRWRFWSGYLPHDSGLPGDAIHPESYRARAEIRSPWALLSALVPWAMRYLQTTSTRPKHREPDQVVARDRLIDMFLRSGAPRKKRWRERVRSFFHRVILGILLLLVILAFWVATRYHARAVARVKAGGRHAPARRPFRRLARRIRCLQRWFKPRMDAMGERLRNRERGAKLIPDEATKTEAFYVLADLAFAMMAGMLEDEVIFKGFDVIDQYDLRAWLWRHGASKTSLDSATVVSAYSYVFAFENGDYTRQCLAAGVAIRLMLRLLLCSRGGVFWEMTAGMGDSVFAPLYELLRKRGVKFEFFHQVRSLRTRDGKLVDEVCLDRQATVRKGENGSAGAYNPLVTIKGVPSWRSCPDYAQLEEGKALEKEYGSGHCDLESAYTRWTSVTPVTLLRGREENGFDRVILGISVGALPFLCESLLPYSPRLKDAVERIKTTRTQSFQLWMTRSLEELGWRHPRPIVTSYADPFDTWGDLTSLLERECWPEGNFPKNIAYFCGVMKDDEDELPGLQHPDQRRGCHRNALKRSRGEAKEWLEKHISELWPNGTYPRSTALDHQLLYRCHNDPSKDLFDCQWFSANVDPSERYVLSVPGTTQYRLRANESGFANLLLAGDWLHTGLNYGCVEAAVMGGFQAARAICGYPRNIYGETDFPADDPLRDAA